MRIDERTRGRAQPISQPGTMLAATKACVCTFADTFVTDAGSLGWSAGGTGF